MTDRYMGGNVRTINGVFSVRGRFRTQVGTNLIPLSSVQSIIRFKDVYRTRHTSETNYGYNFVWKFLQIEYRIFKWKGAAAILGLLAKQQ